MKLGKNIYNEDGRVLLGAGVELTSDLIRRLSDHGVSFIYVFDKRTEDVVVPDIITEETRMRAMQQIRQTFRTLMDQSGRRKAVGSLGKEMRGVLSMIVDDLSRHQDAMLMLMNLSVNDHYLFQHSMNVCIYACMLGISCGYGRDELMTLGLGGLLHDVGKTQIPAAILGKKGKLTPEEFEVMKRHTEIGFQMLKDEANIPLLTAHCALQHHERLDGSGYPRGIRGDEIHDFAQWISLVDSYDAMTTHRLYRPAMLPHQAMEILFTGAGTLYDMEKIAVFRDKVAIYPLGITVRLHTGEVGVVVDINTSSPHRPIVRILKDENGVEVEPYEVDLSKHLSVMITAINEVD